MTLSDKVRQVAFTLAVGSIGALIGYVGNDVTEIVGEMRRKSAAEEQTRREAMERLNRQYTPSSNYQEPRPDPGFYCIGLNCAM